ncbi:4-alpha-glucanotransferase [Pseudorhodoferax sp. Leaf274]|uniref:4-alpha-glucanotransferase n=1 Tax=Pseudorhodoferax sp. Leaf274 TaxID=1736318 RepID=UPI0007037A34|nr:4-alpha-glucanotransferase [Pseudorhodoferax sp. Leaf274]KQP35503.1 4-alpha-glucanotransferase [Pseudorhodoferax sp. Leaf274]
MRLPRASGILLHPTSLPGPHGAGDLGPAAHHFVDWLATAGQKLWQILPLGGVGPGNSPYMSPSAFAGNVLLIDLAALAAEGWLPEAALAQPPAFDALRIDFAAMVPWRMALLAQAAQAFATDARPAQRTAHQAFCVEHAPWLEDYALFMALSEAHPGRDWADWPAPLARRVPAALAEAAALHAERIAFWRFVQWQFFVQWRRLKAYANGKGVAIVGDAPIFIAPQSAEVWARQDLFELEPDGHLSVVAGVPPDYFSATGQRWGNPLYRWSAHAAEGYAWWTARIRHTFALVDVVRIDHFRGFAAHWEIPASEPTAIHGRWVPGPGPALFDAIADGLGPLPIIAEDLGIITPDVDALRRGANLPGMRVLHFAFDGKAQNPYLPHHHEADTVVYTGTHDNDTTRGWWATAGMAEREQAAAYMGQGVEQITPAIHWALIRLAWASVADTAIAPLQDVLGLGAEHRMNLPGEGEGHWAWRFGWDMVRPEHAERLAALTLLYGRA